MALSYSLAGYLRLNIQVITALPGFPGSDNQIPICERSSGNLSFAIDVMIFSRPSFFSEIDDT